MRRFIFLLLLQTASPLHAQSKPAKLAFEKIYALHPGEGVFAYARISPDGKRLAYASEVKAGNRGISRTVTVVDLPTQKIRFSEIGIDAYWSLDGQRMIYSSNTQGSTSIRNDVTGGITRNAAPMSLGDYYSWAERDGKSLILTIESNYYYLNGDHAVLPAAHVKSCAGIGTGDRPLISKDGKQISTFVRGTIVIRDLDDCDNVFDTRIPGAKADFSWDGRYIAFHVQKPNSNGYEIQVVDIKEHTVRTVTSFAGSSFFPSWTRDGRLCFRYDGDDYHGFMMATNVLSVPAHPIPASTVGRLSDDRRWNDIFPETAAPAHRVNVVLIWSTWAAHTPEALADLQLASNYFRDEKLDVGVINAADPASAQADVQHQLVGNAIAVPQIPLTALGLSHTEAKNQSPTTLLFVDGKVVDRKLGAQTFAQLRDWVAAHGVKPAP